MAGGVGGSIDVSQFVEVELDEAGNMATAGLAIEYLNALNPHLWAYFATVEFPGNQVRHMPSRYHFLREFRGE
jgi:hypothetical protein